MAKDPAFLFYASDFLTGTMFMSDEQVGVYIRLLCAQHQHGGRIDTNVLRTYCERITNGHTVFEKFAHDERGSYSPRLEKEMNRRAEKSLKASESVQIRWKKQKEKGTYERNTNVIRSETITETINDLELNKKKAREKKFSAPELIDVQNFMDELNVRAGRPWTDAATGTEAKAFWNYYESNGWKVGRNPMKKWEAAARNWMNNAHKFNQQKINGSKNNGPQRGAKADPTDVFNLFRAKYGTPNTVDSETSEG